MFNINFKTWWVLFVMARLMIFRYYSNLIINVFGRFLVAQPQLGNNTWGWITVELNTSEDYSIEMLINVSVEEQNISDSKNLLVIKECPTLKKHWASPPSSLVLLPTTSQTTTALLICMVNMDLLYNNQCSKGCGIQFWDNYEL